VTDADRSVATLAAVFAPARAPALLGRLGAPGAAGAIAHAVRLASAPRGERLRSLAAALVAGSAAAGRARAVAALERERIAAVVRAPPGAARDGVSPVLLRLCRERCRPDEGRPLTSDGG
jgi:hypothetical protein